MAQFHFPDMEELFIGIMMLFIAAACLLVFALFSSICYIQSVDIADPWLVGVLSVTALIVRYQCVIWVVS